MILRAKFATRCVECGGAIAEGELIDWQPRTVTHPGLACPEPAELVVERPPCPRCFTVPSVTGACCE